MTVTNTVKAMVEEERRIAYRAGLEAAVRALEEWSAFAEADEQSILASDTKETIHKLRGSDAAGHAVRLVKALLEEKA